MAFNVAPHGSLGYHDYITRQRAQQELEQQQMLANLQADQLRAQTAAMRQQSQLQWAQANPQSFPQYAGGGRGGSGVDESMLPEITAPKYLSSDAQTGPANWNEITPDSLKGTNTIAMSIAPPGGNPNLSDAYYRELVPNPDYEAQRAARASEYTKMYGSPALTTAQYALEGRKITAAAQERGQDFRAGTAVAGPVEQATIKGAPELTEDIMNRARGVGGGSAPAPEDVDVEVIAGDDGTQWRIVSRNPDGTVWVESNGKRRLARVN